MKKLISLVLALALVLACVGAAFADGETNNNTISVTGLEGAASATYYKVIEWDDTVGWKWAAPYSANTTVFTAALLEEITGKAAVPGHGQEGDDDYVAPVAAVDGKITSDTANTIAGETNTSSLGAGTMSNGTWTGSIAAGLAGAGLYMVVPTGSGNIMFNPVFVAVNHGADRPITWARTEGYSEGSMAKKSEINLDKKTDKHTFQGFEGLTWTSSAQPGDTITFWVETTIPKFADSYINPVFKVTDNVTTGMNIDTTATNFKVYKGTKDSAGTALTSGTAAAGETAATGDYDVSFTTADGVTSAFVVNFHESFFDSMTANQPIVIEYKATVTNAAPITVNEEDNTVKIDFSNAPDDETGHGHKHDKTKHWTFSIDATILGNSEYHTSELVKIGVNPDGTEKTATTTYDNETEAAPIAGATFQLKKNGTMIRQVTTAADGFIHFEGLDVGTYTLVETEAPEGYVKDNGTYTVVIEANVQEDGDTETLADGCEIRVDKLVSYDVKVTTPSGTTVDSHYTFDAGTLHQDVTTSGNGDITTKIANTPGLELPSTGGIGTTIFYVLGGLLVVGAAVILVARRKAND